jgi:hypothetical protein
MVGRKGKQDKTNRQINKIAWVQVEFYPVIQYFLPVFGLQRSVCGSLDIFDGDSLNCALGSAWVS